MPFLSLLLFLLPLFQGSAAGTAGLSKDVPEEVYIRINQVGYLTGEQKTAILFSNTPVRGQVWLVLEETGEIVVKIRPEKIRRDGWGKFKYYYEADFTLLEDPGKYFLQVPAGASRSQSFPVSDTIYNGFQEELLGFMRQQRCGYNPLLDMVCHQRDGRSAYGPLPTGTYVDVTGGWHDAGDQLKYLITGSYATAHMLLAWEIYPGRFGDLVNDLGQPFPNGIPDVLDEARWGLEWILKMHTGPGQLVHQVADDRDHVGWKMPDEDRSDYGWGENSYRVAYFATGEPQGLGRYKSEATGISNLAGRSAAALAMAARIWKSHLQDTVFARRCLDAAQSLYVMGREKEGFQQGNSYGAPYRYGEETWADDMEWAAAELYRETVEKHYLDDAVHYARLAGTTTWMPHDTAAHYQYYPFVNVGHYSLYALADKTIGDTLASYYRAGIESCLERGSNNPYRVGVPFIWCSNNLLTALITQIILYEKMTGDARFETFLLEQRDWLLGRNPWGTSMFTGIPVKGEYPEDVHTSIYALTGKEVAGGLVDGPVYGTIFRSLPGLQLTEPDEFEDVQNEYVVYHDDIGDYSTNEPTMDGTAGSLLMMVHWTQPLIAENR